MITVRSPKLDFTETFNQWPFPNFGSKFSVLNYCNALFLESCYPRKVSLKVSRSFYGSTVDVAFSVLVALGGHTSQQTVS